MINILVEKYFFPSLSWKNEILRLLPPPRKPFRHPLQNFLLLSPWKKSFRRPWFHVFSRAHSLTNRNI